MVSLGSYRGRTVSRTPLLGLVLCLSIGIAPYNVSAGSVIVRDGDPFFPIGIYHYPESLPLQPRFEELVNAGFNTVLSSLGTPLDVMDDAWEHGIGVIATLGSNMILSPSEDSKKAVLKKHVERLKEHPALLGYEAPDEIAWMDYSDGESGRSREALIRGYAYLKSLDTDHPVWMNHAPRNSITYLRSYSEAGDILGADIYPVPGGLRHSDLGESLNCVGQYTEKLDQIGQGKPIYMVLQGFGWEDVLGYTVGGASGPQPNWLETRFMAYDAICHGANGIIYWGMSYSRIEDEIWSHLKRMASELRDLTPVLLDGWFEALPPIDPELEEHSKMHDGWHYLIVLNAEPKQLEEREIRLPPGWKGDLATVLFENRSLEVTEGRLSDSFAPHDVHIYTDDPRPELALEIINPELLEKDRPTNLTATLRNQGRTGAPPFNLTLTQNGIELARTRVEGLDPLSTHNAKLTWIPRDHGNLSLRVEVDPDNDVEESTAANNAGILTVLVGEAGPDLRVAGLSLPNQSILLAEIWNAGLSPAGSFQVFCEMDDLFLPPERVADLPSGQYSSVSWFVPQNESRALPCEITVDGAAEVYEMLEGNNKAQGAVYVLPMEFYAEGGGAMYPRDLSEDRPWIFRYDPNEGSLPHDSNTCTLVWGTNGWRLPHNSPRNSREVKGVSESPMSKGLDGFWYIVIPCQEANTLEFKFRDIPEWGANWDDNEGEGWRIISSNYVLTLLYEFERVVLNGTAQGAEMSMHETRLSKAWSDYLKGDYDEILEYIGNWSRAAGLDYARRLYELTSEELEEARTLGIDVSFDERLLGLAADMIEKGYYANAESHCNRILNNISEAKQGISEGSMACLLAVASLTSLSIWRCKRGTPVQV